MFRRRRESEAETDDVIDGTTPEAGESGPDEPAPLVRPQGPWDVDDVPEDGINRVDLGSMFVPVTDGLEVRVDVDQTVGTVVSATVASQQSAMQVMAFAAPRSSGIWTEVRAEIIAGIADGGGEATVIDGAYGPEVVASVPTDVPGQFAPARFLGVDGPRWFLRGLVQGVAAVDPAKDPLVLAAFRHIVISRGEEAMAVRDALPLALPKEAVEQAAAAAAAEQAAAEAQAQARSQPDLSLPERGPEITETR
ncbi:MAG TPA: DUF3710 domain-containing protein [Mycobacteriales bacterium]|nr:DUF3710 domain-containing protein [Mycobacteriales bacterium]